MAIHVRIRRNQEAALLLKRRRALAISLCSATTLLLSIGITLFFIRFLILQEEAPHFIAYQPPPVESLVDSRTPSTRELSSSASAPLSAVVPAVIISDAVSAVAFEPSDFSTLDAGFGTGTDALGGLGSGLLPGGLGSGLGDGMGNGGGDGYGDDYTDDGSGRGLNDDIQIVLALDASGSMGALFQTVSAAMEDLLKTLSNCRINGRPARVNIGLVSYGQQDEGGYPMELLPFTQDVGLMREALSNVQCTGSFEPCSAAIHFAVENFPWNMRDRGNILKIIFIAGDEQFHQGNVTSQKAIGAAKRKGIIINTVHCGTGDPDWTKAAKDGHGEAFNINIRTPNGMPTAPRRNAPKEQAHRDLAKCEIIPFGSPQELKMREAEIRSLTSQSQAGDYDQWAQAEGLQLEHGLEWDAAEIARREGDIFDLSMVGGLGNLPPALRKQGPKKALEHIRKAARAREKALEHYHSIGGVGSNNEFCNKALKTIQQQGKKVGIHIKN